MNQITREVLSQRIRRTQAELQSARYELEEAEADVARRRSSIAAREAEIDALVESLGTPDRVAR